MELSPADITIAVTVYSRRDFILEAIRSALNQTVPVKVMVVEDCGPDPTIRDLIVGEFGDRITYHRNERNRGLFDNWNACMDYCTTPWLSILHDDDMLRPHFVETMLGLSRQAPDRAIYFGRSSELSEQGSLKPPAPASWSGWREMDPVELADTCFVLFPGQLFRIADARAVGGVRRMSFFTGDWDLWFRLVLHSGGAQTDAEVSIVRSHYGNDRGTSRVERMGWKWALDNAQRKRNLIRLQQEKGIKIAFDRTKLLEHSPIPTRLLLRYAHGFSRRMLKYNAWLLTHSKPPHGTYRLLQILIRWFGPGSLRSCSALWNRMRPNG